MNKRFCYIAFAAAALAFGMSAKAAGTAEVVPGENDADQCIVQKVRDAAAARQSQGAITIEGAEFAAIKQECAVKTLKTPEFWLNETGLTIAPLRLHLKAGAKPEIPNPHG